MEEENIPTSDRLLLTMHNLCAVRPEIAKTEEELSKIIQVALEYTQNVLDSFEREGYVKSLIDQNGRKRFYLTGMGILRVCSSFT
jgi:hypothetical protein